MAVAVAFDHGPARCVRNGCPEDPQARKLLGCDGDGKVYAGCYSCLGQDPECQVCEETGMGTRGIRISRCSNLCMTPDVRAMMNAFAMYRAGFLPVSGGWMDQAATFVQAMRLLESLRAHHEEIEMERGKSG